MAKWQVSCCLTVSAISFALFLLKVTKLVWQKLDWLFPNTIQPFYD